MDTVDNTDADLFQGIPNPGTWGFDTVMFMRYAFAGYRSFAVGHRAPYNGINDAYIPAFEHGRTMASNDAHKRLKRAQFEANPDRPKTIDWGM